MSNIQPEPTYREKQMAEILDSLAWDLSLIHDRDRHGHGDTVPNFTVKLLRLALHRAEEYAAKVEKDGEESATAALLREDR